MLNARKAQNLRQRNDYKANGVCRGWHRQPSSLRKPETSAVTDTRANNPCTGRWGKEEEVHKLLGLHSKNQFPNRKGRNHTAINKALEMGLLLTVLACFVST